MAKRTTKIFAMRCASAERIDFFEAFTRRRQDGAVEIFGGNVREPYQLSEVYIVPSKHVADIRAFAQEIERDISAAKAMPSRVYAEGELLANDYLAMRERDGVESSLPDRVKAIVKRYGLQLADAQNLGID